MRYTLLWDPMVKRSGATIFCPFSWTSQLRQFGGQRYSSHQFLQCIFWLFQSLERQIILIYKSQMSVNAQSLAAHNVNKFFDAFGKNSWNKDIFFHWRDTKNFWASSNSFVVYCKVSFLYIIICLDTEIVSCFSANMLNHFIIWSLFFPWSLCGRPTMLPIFTYSFTMSWAVSIEIFIWIEIFETLWRIVCSVTNYQILTIIIFWIQAIERFPRWHRHIDTWCIIQWLTEMSTPLA